MSRITVNKLPIDPGPAAWNSILPPAPEGRDLQDKITADWLIVGAGFAGLAAARRLVQLCPGARIVVLEARQVAQGPAGRNSGFMIDLPHDLASDAYGGDPKKDRLLTADNRHAIGFAAQMAQDYGLGRDVFDPRGKVNGAATEKGDQHNKDYAAHLALLGEPSQMLNADAMRAMTGTSYYRSGLFTPGAAMIQPAAFVRGVAAGLAAQNVEIYENSPVTALTRAGDWQVQTPNGQVTAPKVILAVNGHLNSFGFQSGRLMHVFTYASMTRQMTPQEVATLGGDAEWGLTPADPMGTTVRRITGQGGDRIVVRNRFTFDPTMEVSAGRIARVARDHDRAFAARFPMLPELEMEYRWGGRLCLSRNNVSVVQELEPGLYAGCCQNGLGTARGTLSGLLAAELATDTKSDCLSRALTADQPVRLPPAPVARIGAAALLRWQEFKAGREL